MYADLIFALFVIVVFFVVVAIVMFKMRTPFSTWVPIIFSMIALAVSILSALKSDLFPSDIVVIGGNVLLAQTEPPALQQQPEIPIALNLTFINKGYGDDTIEWVAIKATNNADNSTKELRPKNEIDFQKFFNRIYLHSDNFISPFTSFPLPSKSSVIKTIVFYQNPYGDRYRRPASNWIPGKYRFDICIKTARSTSS